MSLGSTGIDSLGRMWPIAFSTGFGAGGAYADCDRSFNFARIPGTRVLSQNEAASLPATE